VVGGLAGTVAKTAVAPFERIRIMQQTGHGESSMFVTTRKVISKEGVRGLWRGNFVNCIRVFPSRGILFSCNDMFKGILARSLIDGEIEIKGGKLVAESGPVRMPFWLSFSSGSLAGMTACIFTYPLDVARTRMSGKLMVGESAKRGMIETLANMVQREGFLSWYRGIGPTLAGSIPYEGIKFAAFDATMRVFDDISPNTGLTNKLVAGAIGGAAAGLVMYPNDTVRRLMQMQGQEGMPILYRNSLDCYIKIMRNEGILRFFNGTSLYLIRMVPNSAIQFGAYTVLRDMFQL